MVYTPLSALVTSRPWWCVALRASGWLLGAIALLGSLLWGWGGLWFQWESNPFACWTLMAAWAATWLGLWWWAWRSSRVSLLWLGGMVVLGVFCLWWSSIAPRDDRPWADDVARITRIQSADSGSDIVTLQDVRNFDWRSERDYAVRWDTRRYDLSQLRSVDVTLSYWMGPAIAHTLVSFGFAGGERVVFSFEIRKERGEAFDALAGFFKRYELALIAADERDILGVRARVRGEQVHLYRVRMPDHAMRALFREYAEQAAQLHAAPRWYHTLTANCTTIVWQMARKLVDGLPLDWRLLASGYLPEYLKQVGGLTPSQPLDALRRTGDITARAQAWRPPMGASDAEASADFSRTIRSGIPPLAP